MGSDKISGWTALAIADACAAYWLWRTGVLSTAVAVVLGAVMILAVRGIVKSRTRRLLRERQEMLTRLASDTRRVSESSHDPRLSGRSSEPPGPVADCTVPHGMSPGPRWLSGL